MACSLLRLVSISLFLPGLLGRTGFGTALVLPDSKSSAANVDSSNAIPAVAKLSPADPSWKLPAVDGGKRQPDAFNETFQKSTNDLWSDEVARGRRLVNYFNEWDIGRLPPQSDYTMNALFRWGWSQQEPTTGKGFHDPQFAWVLEALQADGVDVGTEQLQNEVWKHDQLYQNPDLDGTWAPAYAKYNNWYNARLGVIVAYDIYSPADQAKENPGLHLPIIQRWSDVTWIVWEQQCRTLGFSTGELKYVFHSIVKNDETLDTAFMISPNPGPWPGLLVTPGLNGDDGFAMLGTPNGRGTGWLLVDHREHITRRVHEIYWFEKRTDNGIFYMLLKTALL